MIEQTHTRLQSLLENLAVTAGTQRANFMHLCLPGLCHAEARLVKESEPRLLVEAAGLGVVGALAAQLFAWALRLCQHLFLTWLAGYRPPGLPEEGGVLRQVIGPHGLWLIPVATTLGGLLSGILVYTWAPEAEGHGTDTVVKAFHRAGGFIRARVAPLKLVASAITIGSGGSAGREGPTALIGAGAASIYASLAHRPDEKRQILRSGRHGGRPLRHFSFSDWRCFLRHRSALRQHGVRVRSAALYHAGFGGRLAVNGLFVGWQPFVLLSACQDDSSNPWTMCGSASWESRRPGRDVTSRRASTGCATHFAPCHFRPLNPAIGGLGVGLLALKFPQVLGGGYGWIQEAIDGRLVLKLLLALLSS